MNTSRARPVPGGISAGDIRAGATGTYGGPVFDNKTGEGLMLSNAHVFSPAGASIGDVLIQPGTADGGAEQDRIGKLLRWTKLTPEQEFTIDAAVAKVDNPDLIMRGIVGIGQVDGIVEPQIDMEVHKSGRTTQVTTGKITDISASLTVNYSIGKISLTDLIVFRGTEPVVKGGDSGSLLVTYIDGIPYVVGLVFAGPANPPFDYGVACKIRNVIDAMDISFSSSAINASEKPVLLRGEITDLETTTPIEWARVYCDDLSAYTTADGKYVLGFDDPGEYKIAVDAKGYFGGEIEVNLEDGENKLSLALTPKGELPLIQTLPLILGSLACVMTISAAVSGGEK